MSDEHVSFADDSLMKLRDVCTRTGMGKTTIYRKIKDETFPAAVALGSKSVRWRKSDIDAWMAGLKSQAACSVARDGA